MFHCAMMEFWNSSTTPATTSHITNVPSHAARISPDSSCSRWSASDRAVCWASTICSGMAGTNMATERNATYCPYSAAGMARDRNSTAVMKSPPATVAIMSQPLWRKNEAWCAVAVMEGVSTLSAGMGLGVGKGR